MVKVAKTYNVPKKGTGRRDSLGEITSTRVKTFKGLELLPNEKLKKFTVIVTDEVSLFPWVVPLLPAGSLYHLIDSETYLPTPYTIVPGYEFKVIKLWGSADQPVLARTYFETQLMGIAFHTPGGVYSEQDIAFPSTALIDPDFSDVHILDFTITNIGFVPMSGTAVFTALLIKHGSDPAFEHDTKQVRCPICGVIDTVPISTTKTTCSRGHSFIVEYHPWGGI